MLKKKVLIINLQQGKAKTIFSITSAKSSSLLSKFSNYEKRVEPTSLIMIINVQYPNDQKVHLKNTVNKNDTIKRL